MSMSNSLLLWSLIWLFYQQHCWVFKQDSEAESEAVNCESSEQYLTLSNEAKKSHLTSITKCIEESAQYTIFVTTEVQKKQKWAQSNRVSSLLLIKQILMSL
jgi:hypothetical protein